MWGESLKPLGRISGAPRQHLSTCQRLNTVWRLLRSECTRERRLFSRVLNAFAPLASGVEEEENWSIRFHDFFGQSEY